MRRLATSAIAFALACDESAPPPGPAAADPHADTHADCASCHAEEAARWAESHHARAQSTVVDPSRFAGQRVQGGELVATVELADGQPVVRVKDGAGDSQYAVIATIGVTPLQQYLLDGPGGRLLVAPIAFDVARGQWFDPAPDGAEADPGEELHWAGLAGTWNHQCATCHVTGFDKGFDIGTHSYASEWLAEGVGCVACHGSPPRAARDARAQLDTCSGCHSLRRPLACDAAPGKAFLDQFRPAVGDSTAFGADGRLVAPVEGFEWGSWAQSKMAAKGVRCTDCHDPHGGAPPGNDRCRACHSAPPATENHGVEADCVGCHMPTATFMGVHVRHDHGFKVPGREANVEVFRAARVGDESARESLMQIVAGTGAPAFARATAAAYLRRYAPSGPELTRLGSLSRDPDALVRAEVATTLGAWGAPAIPGALLRDAVRAVRFAAVEAFVTAGGDVSLVKQDYDAVVAEYAQLAACDGDVPGNHLALGRLHAAAGRRGEAVTAFRALLQVEPGSAIGSRALKLLGEPPGQ